MNAVWVFVGGGTGAVCRHGVGLVVDAPWGVLLVNLVGSFFLAIVMHEAVRLDDPTKLAVATGFLGSFTTYSTFNYHVVTALREHAYGSAALQVGATVIGGLLVGMAGWWFAEQWASQVTQ